MWAVLGLSANTYLPCPFSSEKRAFSPYLDSISNYLEHMSELKLPPVNKASVMSGEDLAKKLQSLVGTKFPLTDKPRTNGSTLRKTLSNTLDDGTIVVANEKDYTIVPPKGKGVPHLLACLCDSYIVTTGDSYNLQVWNRFPNTSNDLIRYSNGNDSIKCKDIRFIFVKIDTVKNVISSIVVATPEYLVKKFGVFGVPTIKYQMIISDIKRNEIIGLSDSCFYKGDTVAMSKHTTCNITNLTTSISDAPKSGNIMSLDCIKEKVVSSLVGVQLSVSDTKTKGQSLERIVANLLGYSTEETLVGGYPDIPNQLLEIKVQDSPTVDLGKYSPSNPVVINEKMGLTTEDIRYLIALTDKDGLIEGVILSAGAYLGDAFTFVSDTNYKCQRSIPMSFFNDQNGKAVFNP